MFLSIIIPFVNEERYMIDCLDSLREQNLDDYEIIIVANGSEGMIGDVIKDYDDLNIICKEFDKRIGVSKARNVGLDIAQGEYIYFLDCDDYLYSDGLSKLIEAAKKSGADFINGERMNTAYIRDRIDEAIEKKYETLLLKEKMSDERFSAKLLVGQKTNPEEVLSVLHALIKRDVIADARFIEDKVYNSDYDFIVDIYPNINSFKGVEKSIYAKRIRDDPINLTSLNQEEKEDGFLIYADEYQKVLDRINNSKDSAKYKVLKEELVNKQRDYFFKRYIPRFARREKWRNEYFDAMSQISQDFKIDDLSKKDQIEVKAIQSKNKFLLMAIVKSMMKFNLTKSVIKYPKRIKKLLYYNIFNKLPLRKNQIIFESFNGRFYTDNPKYIYEYMLNNYKKDFRFVWVINDPDIKIPGNPTTVRRFSLRHYWEIARSKYWVINTRQAPGWSKREDQVILSTWHGTPLKRLGFDMGNVYLTNPQTKKRYMKDSKKWDYLVSPNEYTGEILCRAFAYDGEVLQTGYPRNDPLYTYDPEKINAIKNKLNIPLESKVLMYAPTWRDDEYSTDEDFKFKLNLELDKLKKALGDEYVIIIRLHYFIAKLVDLSDVEDFVVNVSYYDDIADLYLISDILITDYSSVFYDFANLRRPILFYTYDLDKYENQLRGFYMDIRTEVPGPLLKTTEEVIDAVRNIDEIEKEYAEKYDEFYERFCSLEDGNASKRIVERVWGK